jgi:hypothetical protein
MTMHRSSKELEMPKYELRVQHVFAANGRKPGGRKETTYEKYLAFPSCRRRRCLKCIKLALKEALRIAATGRKIVKHY